MNFDALTAYLDSLEAKYAIPGLDCKIMRSHEVLYRHTCGHSDYQKKVPVNGTELYDIYSATKLFTMVAVLQLVEKGKLSLEDDLTSYIPEFAETKVLEGFNIRAFPPQKPDPSLPSHVHRNRIRIADLMSMTAGLSYDLEHPAITELLKASAYQADTLTVVREGISRLPLYFEPGTRYFYSLSHDVLAAVVELVSGERFSEYLQHNIFAPLGIEEAYMHPGEKEKPRMAAQWRVSDETGKVLPEDTGNKYRFTANYDSGGAGLACSVDAYSLFIDALACGGIGRTGERILTPESIRQMSTPRLNELQQKDFGRGCIGYSYGLGVRTMIYPSKAKSPVGEFGWDGAAGAFCLVDPVNHLSIFYAQQVLNMLRAYFCVHPTVRDLTYDCLRQAQEL